MGLDLAAIRYVTGSWRATGYVLWMPLVAAVMAAGNLELLIAAAIVMAWRSDGARRWRIFGLAKIAPFLGLPIPWQRQVVVTLADRRGCSRLPWLGLWVDWAELPAPATDRRSASRCRSDRGGSGCRSRWPCSIPRRSYLSGLAVVVAMPSLYLSTLTILIAPLFLFLEERRGRTDLRLSADAESAAAGAGAS